MKFTLERVTEPEIEPIDLAEMKRHLRCFAEVTTEDADITTLIAGAREWVEDYTGRALIDQTWRLTLDGRRHAWLGGDRVGGYSPGPVGFGEREWRHWIARGEILLRRAPILAVTSFVSVDAAGIESDIDPATFALREADSKWPRIVPLNGVTWPAGTLRIEFRAGFADRLGSPQQGAEQVPVRLLQAMKLWAESMYDRDPVMMPLLLNVAERLVKSERAESQIA